MACVTQKLGLTDMASSGLFTLSPSKSVAVLGKHKCLPVSDHPLVRSIDAGQPFKVTNTKTQ